MSITALTPLVVSSQALPGGPPGVQGPPGAFVVFGINFQVATASYTVGPGDLGKMIIFSGTTAGVALTLPPQTAQPGWWAVIRNDNVTGAITITTTGGALIDGGATATVNSGSTAFVVFNGTDFEIIATSTPASFMDQSALVGAANNLIINGTMEVDQIHLGALQAAFASGYAIDMVKVQTSGAQVISVQQIADAPPGLVKSLKIAVSTANPTPGSSDVCYFLLPIEGRMIARLGFGASNPSSVSLGFYVKTFQAGVYGISLVNGANNNRNYATTFTVAASGVWQWVSVTIPGDTTGTWATDNTNGMSLAIWMMAGLVCGRRRRGGGERTSCAR
jgi:hypothetical protein